MRILVADDDETLRSELAALLVQAGHEVHTARDGEEALLCLQNEPIDIAFLDWAMPGETGIDVLHEAKKLRPKTAFVLMTGYATVDTAVDALKSGASDFVQKPFEVDSIEKIVGSVQRQLSTKARPSSRGTHRRAAGPFDVKMAFLHYRTGVLMASKALPGEGTADHDLLVATLDVIRNFMETSFSVFRRKHLRAIRMGDYTLTIEGGRYTSLTVVVRGEDKEELRTHLRAILREFEAENARVLASWEGELDLIHGADLLLEALVSEHSWAKA